MGHQFLDKSPIWQSDVFPARLPVNVLIQLTAETAVPVYESREILSSSKHPQILLPGQASSGDLQSPNRFKEADGRVFLDALRQAQTNRPVIPVDPKKLQKKAKVKTFITKAEIAVTIPEETEPGINRKLLK